MYGRAQTYLLHEIFYSAMALLIGGYASLLHLVMVLTRVQNSVMILISERNREIPQF